MSHQRTRPTGQNRQYGILVGKARQGQMDPSGRSPHYEVWIDAGQSYRIAVNVQSVDGSNVLAYFDPNYVNPTKLNIPARALGASGFTALKTGPGGEGLDYLRDRLFPLDKMTAIPDEGSGISLANLLDTQFKRAAGDAQAVVVALGQFFEGGGRDQTFGFSPELGVHDIHMMQGNGGKFADDNQVYGDGALFVRHGDGAVAALFVRFSIQDMPTNDTTGAPD